MAQRRGLKKAAVAVAHRILLIAWHILAEQGVEYYEHGGDHFDRRNPERTARKLSRRLEAIGYKVTLVAPPKPFGSPSERATRKRSQTIVETSVCPKCARWGMPRCICLVKRKRNSSPPHTKSAL